MTTLPVNSTSLQAELEPILGNEGPGSFFSLSRSMNANPFDRLYTDAFGRATFDPVPTGFGASVAGRLMESAGTTELLGGLGKTALRSGVDWVASLTLENAYRPKVRLPGGFMDNDEGPLMVALRSGTKEASKVRLADYWETIDPMQRRMMEQNGMGLQTFQSLGMQTADEFAEKWPSIVTAMRAHQMIEDTRKESPVLSAAAGVTEFGMQLVTDPFLWLSLGASSVAKTGAKQAVREALEQGIKGTTTDALKTLTTRANRWRTVDEILGQGPVQYLAGRNITEGRQLTARALLQGTGVLYGADAGAAMGYAQQHYMLTNGLADPSAGLETPYFGIALGGAIGLGASELGLRMMNRSYGMISNGDYSAYGGVYNLATDIIQQKYQRGQITLDSLIDPKEIESAEAVGDFIGAWMTREQVRQIAPLMDDWLNPKQPKADGAVRNPGSIQDLRDFLMQVPTSSELKAFLSGGIPAGTQTQLGQIRDQLFSLSDRIRDAAGKGNAKTAEALRRQLAEYQNNYMRLLTDEYNITDIGNPTKLPGLVESIRAFVNDVPISTLPSADLRSAEITRRLRKVFDDRKGSDFYTTQVIPWIQNNRILQKVTTLLNPAQRARVAMTSDDPVEVVIGKLVGILDYSGFHINERFQNADGSLVDDTRTRMETLVVQHLVPVEIVASKAIKGMTRDQAKAVFDEAIVVAAGLKSSDSQAVNSIASAMRTAFDDIGERAARVDYIRNRIENYVPTYRRPDSTPEQDAVAEANWVKHSMRMFGKEAGPEAPVHYNTLAAMGYVKKHGGTHTKGVNMPDDFSKLLDEKGEQMMPAKVGDIGDRHLEDYYNALGDSVQLEAEWINRRQLARANDFGMYDPEADVDIPIYGDTKRAEAMSNFVRNDASRRIEQDIMLDPDMLKHGLIETDPTKIMQYYIRSSGYNIVRSEALSELFGEAVSWKDLMRGLDALPKSKQATDMLDLLKNIDNTQAGRVRMSSEGAVLAYSLGQSASAVTNAAVVPTILATEGSTSIVRAIMSPQLYSDFADTIKDAMKYLVDSNYARLDGVEQEFEKGSGRVMVEFDDLLPQNIRHSTVAATAQLGNSIARDLSGERAITRGFRGLHFRLSYSKLSRHSSKLDRLSGLQRRFETLAEEKGAARAAGISHNDMVMLRSAGVLSDDMLGIAKKITEMNPKALSSRQRLLAAVSSMDSEADRALGRELDRRLSQMARDDAGAFVAQPTATSRATASGSWARYPLLRLMAGFTSWAMTFQNRTMARIGTAAYHKQAGFLGLFLASEMMNQMYRDIMYGGYSPEDAAEKWKKDPVKNTAILLSRMPVWGPFNPATGLIQMFAAGYGGGLSSVVDSPALSLADRSIRSTVSVGQDLLQGKAPSDADIRTMNRVVPGWNLWYLQGLRRTYEQFESDSDR